jgi:hypothetical protein
VLAGVSSTDYGGSFVSWRADAELVSDTITKSATFSST